MEILLKLKFWNCKPEWIPEIINELKKERFLDEQRFANSFARGKFRMKSWGKLKIMGTLLQHNISQDIINKALNEIDENDYRNTLANLLEKKWKVTTGEQNSKVNKTAAYAINKGYESGLVFKILRSTTFT
ncbi:MAG: RecX family transcriptional regulator [Bacteroidales bacterium]|jgi:regulatory protein|nr:RecX family transcriptional regulator [Bacteroidales bacterium]